MTAQPVGRSLGSRTWLALMPISSDPEFFRQVNVIRASHWPDSLGIVREALGFSPLEPGHVVHLAISETGKSRAPVSHCRKYEFTSASTWASLFLRGRIYSRCGKFIPNCRPYLPPFADGCRRFGKGWPRRGLRAKQFDEDADYARLNRGATDGARILRPTDGLCGIANTNAIVYWLYWNCPGIVIARCPPDSVRPGDRRGRLHAAGWLAHSS
jgi:hypothetical protein